MLDKNTHGYFDADAITFTPEGDIIIGDNQLAKEIEEEKDIKDCLLKTKINPNILKIKK